MITALLPMHTGEFDDLLNSSSSKFVSEPVEEIDLRYCSIKSSNEIESNGMVSTDKCQKLLDVDNLTVQTPGSKATLVRDLSLAINQKEHLLVSELVYTLNYATLQNRLVNL